MLTRASTLRRLNNVVSSHNLHMLALKTRMAIQLNQIMASLKTLLTLLALTSNPILRKSIYRVSPNFFIALNNTYLLKVLSKLARLLKMVRICKQRLRAQTLVKFLQLFSRVISNIKFNLQATLRIVIPNTLIRLCWALSLVHSKIAR